MATIAGIATAVLFGKNDFKVSSKLSSSFVINSSTTLRFPQNASWPSSSRRSKLHKSVVHAEYSDHRAGGSGGDFVAGFLLGGAIFGTLAYVFAPQIRRSILNEDEYGFRRARRPIYYDEGLEKTRQTLNEKITQLNSAIDNVSSRLRGRNNVPPVAIETDPEEATM
ncbi:OLC1v1021025C1 [Oldenlandia corymbosa var. corymbosa]|uniref:OLC1v1021025C1 n=1 Tax=Oldenlandia corymbosa var. corymbosa TaxID=529605 RepID=A0AAV1BX79_OLDCO|nr:OLC1v1021025C1 [Oldenlandia corymbosa var. corymbosa]